jgi:ribosomal-protein-alanine N-acetyltransferase
MWPQKPKKTPPAPQPVTESPVHDGIIHIRWIITKDYDAIIAIERESFEHAWTRAELTKFLKHHAHIGYVAVLNGEVVGYFLYELHPSHFELVGIAVHPKHRRAGIATKMMGELHKKMISRRGCVKLLVRETNVAGQQFFKSVGYMATGLVKGAYDECADDGVAMVKRRVERKVDEKWLPVNRVEKFFDGAE